MTAASHEPLFATDPYDPLPETAVPEHFVDEVLLRMQRQHAADGPGERDGHGLVTRDSIESIARWLGGGEPAADDLVRQIEAARPWEISGLSLLHRYRLYAVLGKPAFGYEAQADDLPADYRQVHEALERAGVSDEDRHRFELSSLLVHGRSTQLRPILRGTTTAWQHHVERPALLWSILGVGTPTDRSQQPMVTAALGTLIAISEHGPLSPSVTATVAEYAIGPFKAARPVAQQLLGQLPDGVALMATHLTAQKSDIREEAATWIGLHGTATDAVILRQRLAQESHVGVRAALLGALIRLGTPPEELLTHEALTDEAVRHADADRLALSWFPEDGWPQLKWADGTPIASSVPQWWLVLADQIGDPSGKGLIPRYLDTLDPASADDLGRAVLDAWITRDTLCPTPEEVRADPAEYYEILNMRMSSDGGPQRTPEERLEYALRFRHRLYLTSAITHRGMLALATRTDGTWFAERISRFLRDHRPRRAQAEALLRAAGAHPSTEALHLLLTIARRYRQKTIQALAVELIAEQAALRGWTPAQLADRTVPSAGLDDKGRLVLDFGPRQFIAALTQKLTLTLHDSDPEAPDVLGMARKTLPAPVDADDAELAAEAKKELSQTRSELKRIVTAQRARLHEAMVVQQRWPAADWLGLLRHPILGRLATDYVWAAHGPGDQVQLFRPTGAEKWGDSVDITIAHAAVIDASLLQAWRTAQGRLPAQLAVPGIDLTDPMRDGADALEDFRGWIIESTHLQRLATKHGYQRGQAESGVVFAYTKHYEQAQVRVNITFTGSRVGQAEGTVSLLDVHFVHARLDGGAAERALPLTEVPAVLLAEAYAVYATIAQQAMPDPASSPHV